MDDEYKDDRTRELFEDDREFRKAYGPRGLKNRDRRLNEIVSSLNVADLLRLGSQGPGRWHILDNRHGGEDKGKIFGDLTGSLRILLSAPTTPLGKTTSVIIIEIRDTHTEK